jgi:hypothetical protein
VTYFPGEADCADREKADGKNSAKLAPHRRLISSADELSRGKYVGAASVTLKSPITRVTSDQRLSILTCARAS